MPITKVSLIMAVEVSRHFRLLEALEAGEKAQNLPPNISFGDAGMVGSSR
jgi:hypothetical protein